MQTFIECPICLSDIIQTIALIPCGHEICLNCYEECQKEEKKTKQHCPICQNKILVKQEDIDEWDLLDKNNLIWKNNPYNSNNTNNMMMLPHTLLKSNAFIQGKNKKIADMTDAELERDVTEIKLRRWEIEEQKKNAISFVQIEKEKKDRKWPLQIRIKQLDGKIVSTFVRQHQTAGNLAIDIAKRFNMTLGQIRLVFRGIPLAEDISMQQIGICENEIIYVLLQMRGDIGEWEHFSLEKQNELNSLMNRIDYKLWVEKKKVLFSHMYLNLNVHQNVQIYKNYIPFEICSNIISFMQIKVKPTYNESQDFQYSLSYIEVRNLVGKTWLDRLTKLLLQGILDNHLSWSKCIVRKVSANSSRWIPFHLDEHVKTLQLILNSSSLEQQNGQTLYVGKKSIYFYSREVGTVVVHSNQVLHAITPVVENRWSLFLLM